MKLAIKDEGDVKEKGEDLVRREEESRIGSRWGGGLEEKGERRR